MMYLFVARLSRSKFYLSCCRHRLRAGCAQRENLVAFVLGTGLCHTTSCHQCSASMSSAPSLARITPAVLPERPCPSGIVRPITTQRCALSGNAAWEGGGGAVQHACTCRRVHSLIARVRARVCFLRIHTHRSHYSSSLTMEALLPNSLARRSCVLWLRVVVC